MKDYWYCIINFKNISYFSAEISVPIILGVIPWPSRSPVVSHPWIRVCGFIKDPVFSPPLPKSIPDLKSRINTAVVFIEHCLKYYIWQEKMYRWDIWKIRKRKRIEHS